jgi:hypothetical protein
MPFVTEHPPGAPCWFELGVTDQAAAKHFYTQLFGWEAVDYPMGPGQFYTMFKLDGHDAGAAYTLPAELAAQGVPPHWRVYFATASADESAAKVAQLGGAVVHAPFDVMGAGRMAICKDPGDAVFTLWEPKAHKGAGVIGQDNAVCWTELATWDTGKARSFYEALCGWSTRGSANMPTYIEFSVAGSPRGGLLPMDEQWKGIPSHWGIYFRVADCDAAVAKAKELGATVRYGPFDAPGVGRMAMLADPQGAGFSVITLMPAAV